MNETSDKGFFDRYNFSFGLNILQALMIDVIVMVVASINYIKRQMKLLNSSDEVIF
jgi:hypothetical protein